MNNLIRPNRVHHRSWRQLSEKWPKILAVLIIAAAALASFILPPTTKNVGNIHMSNDPVFQAFKASGSEIYASNLSGWAQINNKYLSTAELYDLGMQTVQNLGLDPATVKCQPTEEKGFRGLEFTGRLGANTKAAILVQTWDPPVEDTKPDPETYMIINLEDPDSVDMISRERTRLVELFASFEAVPNINMGITGTINGLIPAEEKRSLAQVIFNAAGAEVVESLIEPGMISFTGYTPAIKESLLAGSNKINLNVALRYHSIDGKTYIHIASPIIMSEY